jgi:hypothetical protein
VLWKVPVRITARSGQWKDVADGKTLVTSRADPIEHLKCERIREFIFTGCPE